MSDSRATLLDDLIPAADQIQRRLDELPRERLLLRRLLKLAQARDAEVARVSPGINAPETLPRATLSCGA